MIQKNNHHKQSLIHAAICLLLAVWALPAQGQDCFDESAATKEQLVIDAHSGEIIHGRDFYQRNTALDVVVTRKNPFRYTYSYSAEHVELRGESAVTSLFGLLAPLAVVGPLWDAAKKQAAEDDIAEATSDDPATDAPPRPGMTRQACTGDERAFIDRFAAEAAKLSSEAKSLSDDVKAKALEFNTAQPSHEEFTKLTTVDRVDCASALTTAQDAKSAIKDFRVGKLPERASKHAEKIDELSKLMDFFQLKQQACKERIAYLREVAAKLDKNSTKLESAIGKLYAGEQSFKNTVALIDEALASQPFYEHHQLPARRVPKESTVKVCRKQRGNASAAEACHSTTVQFGYPIFSLGIGLGISSIAEEKFGKEVSQVPDGSGGTMLGERFARTDRSGSPILGSVLLHANLWPVGENGNHVIAPSFGVSIGDDDEASAFGYLFGLSGGFADHSFYVTLAYHSRKVKTLGGDFALGDVVPMGVDDVPLRTESKGGVMLVFTRRFR